MLLVAAAVPAVERPGSVPVGLLKALEGIAVLTINTQILLHLLVCTKTQEAAEGIGLRAAQLTAYTVVIGIAETPTLQARVDGNALPVPGLGLLDLLKLCLQLGPLTRLEREAVGLRTPGGRQILSV